MFTQTGPFDTSNNDMYNFFEFGYMDYDDGSSKAGEDMPHDWIFENIDDRWERWDFLDNRIRDRENRCPGYKIGNTM